MKLIQTAITFPDDKTYYVRYTNQQGKIKYIQCPNYKQAQNTKKTIKQNKQHYPKTQITIICQSGNN